MSAETAALSCSRFVQTTKWLNKSDKSLRIAKNSRIPWYVSSNISKKSVWGLIGEKLGKSVYLQGFNF